MAPESRASGPEPRDKVRPEVLSEIHLEGPIRGSTTTTAWDRGEGRGGQGTHRASQTHLGTFPLGFLFRPPPCLGWSAAVCWNFCFFLPELGFPCSEAQISESQVFCELYSYRPEFQRCILKFENGGYPSLLSASHTPWGSPPLRLRAGVVFVA